MSVILDALRRSRKGATRGAAPLPAEPRQVPAGLGLGGSSSAWATGVRPGRTRILGLGLLLVIGLGGWAAIQVARTLINSYAPSAQSSASAAPGRATPPAATPEVPPPPSSVTDGAPLTATPGKDSEQPPSSVVLRSVRRPRQNAQSLAAKNQSQEPKAQSQEPKAPGPEPTRSDGVNHFEVAVRYHNLGNYEEARKHYLAVIAADEFNVEARNNLGLLHHRRGMTQDAIEEFRRAIAINPRYVRARSNLAVVLLDAGRPAEARAELRAAMMLEPRNADLIVNMALVEKADQHRDQAIELLVRAIGYQPTHGMAHYNVAVLYEEQSALALAYDHYTEFLRYAGPEHGELLTDVQRRLLAIKPKLGRSG